MIGKARNLNKLNQRKLLAYLHYLHIHELIPYHWVYPEFKAHWI